MNAHEPAFPMAETPTAREVCGFTKREWIAVMAIQGLLADSATKWVDPVKEIPAYAVKYTDALIAELS